MPAKRPKPGDIYRLKGAVPGDQAPPPGISVTVREIVPAEEKGANAFNEAGRSAEAQAEIAALVDRQRREYLSAGGAASPVGPASTQLLAAASRDIGAGASGVAGAVAFGQGDGAADELAALLARQASEYEEATAPYQADAVVVEWPVPVAVFVDGEYRPGTLHRAWAVAVDEFGSLFEEA